MGKNNRFREDALKYWDIRCEDAWTRFEEAVRENPYLTAKEFCIKDMGCVDQFMKWARRTKHNITRLRQQALDERKKAKGLERRNSTDDPTPGNMFIKFVPKKEAGLYPFKGISLTFPDGVNLSLQECTAEGLSSLLDIYNKRKEASVCSH